MHQLLAVTGITNKSLRALMTGLLGGANYTMNQASYDLARLPQRPDHPHPGTQPYRLTADGLRVRDLLHQGARPATATPARRRPATRTTAELRQALHTIDTAHHTTTIDQARLLPRQPETQDNSQSPSDQGSLRRVRDFARKRWPFGQFWLRWLVVLRLVDVQSTSSAVRYVGSADGQL